MKILIVCKSLPTRLQGGIQTHVWKLSENLVRLGHDVHILTAGSWKEKEKRYNIEGRNIIEIPYLPMFRQPILPLFFEELSFNWSVKNWLKRHETAFDIIHIQGRSGFLYPQYRHKTPIVATFHGLVTLENKYAMRTRTLDVILHEKWASKYEKNTLKNSDALIAVSQEMHTEMVSFVENMLERVTLISNGVDCDKADLSFVSTENNGETEDKLLVFVGRIDRIKGIHNLIQAMKKVNPSVRLVVIGDGNDLNTVKKSVQTEGGADRIIFTGALPNKDVLAWIRKSYALILPSFHETQGIVLLEANACGKPVLASNLGGIKEVVSHGENGFLFDPHTIEEITNAINTLFDMPEKAKEMGKNGRKLVEQNYTWDKIALETVNLYGKTIFEFTQKLPLNTTKNNNKPIPQMSAA
jgi:glycosyltransferase involved in cell wall biosynthesis